MDADEMLAHLAKVSQEVRAASVGVMMKPRFVIIAGDMYMIDGRLFDDAVLMMSEVEGEVVSTRNVVPMESG